HRAKPSQVRDAAISALRIHVPECAIERVARRTRRQRGLQRVAVEPRKDRAFHRLKRGDDAVNALAVPLKRHSFTAAARVAVGEIGDNEIDGSLDSMRGHKRSRERPRAAGDRQSLRMWRHVCLNPFVDLLHSAVRFILVNSAGIRKDEKANEARWNEILKINLMGYAPDGR